MINVIDILTNDSTLTDLLTDGADGIYIGQALRTDRSPFLVLTNRLLTASNSSDSGASNGMWEVFVMSFAHDYSTVRSVANAVANSLDNCEPQTTSGEYLQWCRLQNESVEALKEDNIDYFMIEQRFETYLTK